MKLLLAIDQGTTGTTTLVMDEDLNRIAEASVDFPQHFPKPGWVEHDPAEIWASVVKTVTEVTQKIDPKKIAAIGITNQRETVCFWDKKTGEPIARALVWQDRRTATDCEALKKRGLEKLFQERTGLLLDPYFSGTKAAWAIQNWGDVKKAADQGRLAIGTIDSFLISRLSGGKAHVTEASNASRTLAFDIHRRAWDDELCRELGVPKEAWPEVKLSAGIFATTQNFPSLPNGIPITGVLGDQQAALLGQACLKEGQAKCTYGTGAFLLMNTGSTPVPSKHRLLTTVAWELEAGKPVYALEGSAFIAGAAIQWLRDGLGIISDAPSIEALAASVPSSEGVMFVPALTGMGAPYWDPQATGTVTGITRGTTRAHLARAALEGIAFQNADLLGAMQKDLGKPLQSLNVDGGAAANSLLMQIQSNLLGVELRRPHYLETTSLGALFAAGLGVGIFSSQAAIERTWKKDRSFHPEWSAAEREGALALWHGAVKRALLKP